MCKVPCAQGQVVCGGVCVDTQSDDANCGSCGNACGGGSTCSNGACELPIKACLNDFSVGYPSQSLAYYTNNGWGTTFTPPTNWLGGDAHGDPGNWDVPDECWGRTTKQVASITFSDVASSVSFSLRGEGWTQNNIVIRSYLGGVLQETLNKNVTGSYTTFPVVFSTDLDTIEIDTTNSTSSFPVPSLVPNIVDNLAYTGRFGCSVVQ